MNILKTHWKKFANYQKKSENQNLLLMKIKKNQIFQILS